MRRYQELHGAVSLALLTLGRTDLVMSDTSLDDIRKEAECPQPFEEATVMMSTEKNTSMSQILVVVRQLQHSLKTETSQCELRDHLLCYVSQRFPNPESTSLVRQLHYWNRDSSGSPFPMTVLDGATRTGYSLY